MEHPIEVKWTDEPLEEHYLAAESYLKLLYKPRKVRRWVNKLREAPLSEFAAKDILRASETSMSEITAFDWAPHRRQIEAGETLAPILLVRQDNGSRLIVADGFHRMCALFAADEKIRVPCKIA